MSRIVIRNATLINEGERFEGDLRIKDGKIDAIAREGNLAREGDTVIDGEGKWLLPGAIDDQVHFREPGLTHKEDIHSGSRAAVAGGITSFMEMPNTKPQSLTQELLEEKYQRASEVSLANYSFYMGASNDNLEEVLKTDPATVCGVKIFMGASTGNMLVDDQEALEGIFANCELLIATHCEDEATIRTNLERYKEKYGDDIPIACHPEIRSEEACYLSSSRAVELARKQGTRLHVLHISTEKELELFHNDLPLEERKVTAEACIHHLWFTDADYETKGTLIKWNPAVKRKQDREAVLDAVASGRIGVVATDHAPHTLEEKGNPYTQAPSGGPLVQHALPAMLEHCHNERLSVETVVERMAHGPARLFGIRDRGYLREGYQADLVLVDPNDPWTVDRKNILYKCGWSPFEGTTFRSRILRTFVNGEHVYRFDADRNAGQFDEKVRGERLSFNPRS